MDGTATAIAHPIQGLVKYHGMRDAEMRYPYHDSISVCTAPSHSLTTVSFDAQRTEDTYIVDGEPISGSGAERIRRVVNRVRERAGIDTRVRMESENDFPTNVGFGSSSSGFAAVARAACAAAGLDLSLPEISTIARLGSASAARSVTGGFSILYGGMNDADCRAVRLETTLEDELRIIAGLVPMYKETARAHAEATDSHMFEARLAHVHHQLAEMRDALRAGSFERVFSLAEHDSLSLAATTMTGPAGWVYWQPETLRIFEAVTTLREDEHVPVYFSTDTGASVYVNTTTEFVETVEDAIADCGVETRVWEVGGPARVVDDDRALF